MPNGPCPELKRITEGWGHGARYTSTPWDCAAELPNPRAWRCVPRHRTLPTRWAMSVMSVAYPYRPNGGKRHVNDFEADFPVCLADQEGQEIAVHEMGCRVDDVHLHNGTAHLHIVCAVKRLKPVAEHMRRYAKG